MEREQSMVPKMLVLIIFFIWVDTGLEIHLPKPLTKERMYNMRQTTKIDGIHLLRGGNW